MIVYPSADTHCDTLLNLLKPGAKWNDPIGSRHLTVEGMKKGGVRIQFFACFPAPRGTGNDPLAACMELIDRYHLMLQDSGGQIAHLTAGNLKSVLENDSIGAVLTIEGGDALEGQISYLRNFFRLGVKLITLTWNNRNELGDGVGETRSNGGLTRFGAEVVREMNRLSMMVDVSHLNERGFWDVMDLSAQPPIASHSNARAVTDHARNLTDEQIRSLVKKGGYIGINFCPAFLRDPKEGNARIGDILRHIERIASLGGIGCVGFGSDYDGVDHLPDGIRGPESTPEITDALLQAGFSDDEVRAIAMGNLLRYIKPFL